MTVICPSAGWIESALGQIVMSHILSIWQYVLPQWDKKMQRLYFFLSHCGKKSFERPLQLVDRDFPSLSACITIVTDTCYISINNLGKFSNPAINIFNVKSVIDIFSNPIASTGCLILKRVILNGSEG